VRYLISCQPKFESHSVGIGVLIFDTSSNGAFDTSTKLMSWTNPTGKSPAAGSKVSEIGPS
jgi:hypothetical protein